MNWLRSHNLPYSMKTKILMVCLGNICRSPLAEGILRSKVDPGRVEVDSAGTQSYHTGEPPCEFSQKIARENGLDISGLRARAFEPADFDRFDLIYVMDRHNLDTLHARAPGDREKNKVKLILDEVFPGENMDVPDPYYSQYYAFKNIYKMLDEACKVIAQKYNR